MSAIEASLRLEISQYQQQLAKATGAVAKFKEDAKAKSQGMAQAVMGKPDDYVFRGKYADSFRRSVQAEGGIGGGLMGQGVMTGLGRVAGPAAIAGLIGAGLKMAADRAAANSVMQVRAEVLVGNKEDARRLLDDLRELGARTPLEFPDLAAAGQQLVAFGESAAQVPETLRRIGDVATGVNAPLGEIAEIYGKARVQNQLFAEDINQLTGRGIPVIQEFARILGRPEAEIKKLASEGRITFPLLEAAFINLTKEGGKFGGMMDRISQESSGKWSTVKDDLNAIVGSIGKPIDAAQNWGLTKVLSITGSIKELFSGEAFMPSLQRKKADAAAAAQGKGSDSKDAEAKAAFDKADKEKAAAEATKAATKAAEEKAKQQERVRSLQEQITEQEISRLKPAEQLVQLSELQRQKIDEMRNAGGLFFDATVEGMAAFAAAQAKDGKTGAEETLRRYQEILRIQQQISGLSSGLRNDAADSSAAEAQAKAAESEAWWNKIISEEKERQAQTDARTSLGEEIALMQAKANGQTQLVEAMERELAIRQRTEEIMSRTGMGQDEARAAASKIESLKGQADARDKASASSPSAASPTEEAKSKIMGFSAKRQGGVYERQDHLYNDPRKAAANADPTQQQLGPQAARNAANAQPQQAAANPQQQLGQQALAIMQAILEAVK